MDNLFKEYEGVFIAEGEVETSKEKKEPFYSFSPFALQDALGAKDIKNTWLEYQKLRFAGIEVEEIIHKIVSKVRDMTAISLGATKENLNIKSDFPYNKSKKDLKNWKLEELKNLYSDLVSIYHRSRLESGANLDIALEKILLKL